MISRDEIYTLLMLRNRQGSIFSTLPMDVIREISAHSLNLNTDIEQALHHAAYARLEDVDALLSMLDKNPRLLLQRGDVQTPGGDVHKRITIYEFLLGDGDYELALKVKAYFDKIDNGELIRSRQEEPYRPLIEGMLTQKPYDLTPLIELIKEASPETITALLNFDMTGDSELCKAIIQFRKDWAPKIFCAPNMHYNYASLKHAFDILWSEWGNLCKASNNNYDKIDLVWRQLIGFEMRRLPGIDRCAIAQGLYYLMENKEAPVLSYKLRNGDVVKDFPITITDDSLAGLGGDFCINLVGWRRYAADTLSPFAGLQCARWKTYVEQKLQTYRTYAVTASSSTDASEDSQCLGNESHC